MARGSAVIRSSSFFFCATLASIGLGGLSACSGGASREAQPSAKHRAHIPNIQGPDVPPGELPDGSSQDVTLSNGADIVVQNVGGQIMLMVEGTLTGDAFTALRSKIASKPAAEQKLLLQKEVDAINAKLKTQGAIPLQSFPEVAYFSFLFPYESDVLGKLKALNFAHELSLEPVVNDRQDYDDIKKFSPAKEGLTPLNAGADLSGYSGLKRIHVAEFLDAVESSVGTKPTGSNVRVGIADTGITFNHSTFTDSTGKRARIDSIKDSTGEGFVYFPANSVMKVTADPKQAEDLLVEAEVIPTPRLPARPYGDQTAKVKDLRIKVSPELKNVLLNEAKASGAQLGILFEDSLQAAGEEVDLNHNGKLNDRMLVIRIPGPVPALYFDASGSGDFRQSKALRDFNDSGDMISLFAEKVGFQFGSTKLPSASGRSAITVDFVAMVGFDPGNHGSHVAGIIGGRRTVRNDNPLTMARGVAPATRLHMNRVCSNNAGCNATAAIIDLAMNENVDVINMSLGGLNAFNDGYGVQESVINRLTGLKNVLFVISAGNSGPARQTVGSPSVARLALSIGATASHSLIERQYGWPSRGTHADDDDFMLFFSSRGPSSSGGFKPNLSAPGTELSSVQLNSAPGSRAGLDVYWGTSMAAPTATGAYALLLDAIRLYNENYPQTPMPTQAQVLRRVLMASARPFDAKTFSPLSGEKTDGQYTWIDEGTGMLDLAQAWKLLLAIAEQRLPTSISQNGQPVELDYEVLAARKNPNGITYDGSRAVAGDDPSLAQGLYLDPASNEKIVAVSIKRQLPEDLRSSEQAGDLTRDLLSSMDEFELRTVFYGSDKEWFQISSLDTVDCNASPTQSLVVLGAGAEVQRNSTGQGHLNPFGPSTLNLCLNRKMIAALPAGDHGALIHAYRRVGSKVALLPSFTVPVYMVVPHHTLAGSLAYEIHDKVRSFGLSRNYVRVPAGTSLLRLTLEVPEIKAGEACSGVELMALTGANTRKLLDTRAAARVANCDSSGAAINDEKARKLVVTKVNPPEGLWDLHVFGQYRFPESKFTLRVDYLSGEASKKKIAGGTEALEGQVEWKLLETSQDDVSIDSEKSVYEMTSLFNAEKSSVKGGDHVFIKNPLGLLRRYPEGVRAVVVRTDSSDGNDIDLMVLRCPEDATTAEDSRCKAEGQSGESNDIEQVRFVPRKGFSYAVRIDGYEVNGSGAFRATEELIFASQKGALAIKSPTPGLFEVRYSFEIKPQIESSLFQSPLFSKGSYIALGSISLRLADDSLVGAIPVEITP